MKPLFPLVLFTLACLASSCGKRQTHPPASGPVTGETPAAGYCLPASTAWSEEEYTQWMTRAELQYFQDQAPQGHYFAHVEGRNNAGLCEYRAVRKPLPADQYVEAAVFWGLSDKEVFDAELDLLRRGFVRKSMQVFVNASGVALHQLVWLKPVGTPAPAPQTAASIPPEPVPADESSGLDHPATAVAAEPETAPTADISPPEVKPPTARVVPPAESAAESRVESRAATERDAASPKKFTTYTVVQGDVMEKIARRQHTTVEAILAANNLKNDSLQIGQKLKIPKK